MKLINHASKWGNLYRHRYYKDGRRITEKEYLYHLGNIITEEVYGRKLESHPTWFRVTYTYPLSVS